MDKSLMRECFHNCLTVEEENGLLMARRFTKEQCDYFGTLEYGKLMKEKGYMTAGVTIEFETNAPSFTMSWQIVDGYPVTSEDRGSTLDVYVNDILCAQQVIDCEWHVTQETTFMLPEGRKKVEIYLPHLMVFGLEDINTAEGNYFLAPIPKRAVKVLAIGDSITQGVGALYSSTGYAMQLGRMLNCECVNQSIAAICFEKQGIVNDGFTPDLITVALGTNDWSLRKDKAEYDEYASAFLKQIDVAYPNVPVAVISPVKRCRGEADLPEDRPDLYKESELYGVLTKLCEPYPQMRCIDGWQLIPHVPGFFMDGLHPNDLGMTWYAHGVMRALEYMMQ